MSSVPRGARGRSGSARPRWAACHEAIASASVSLSAAAPLEAFLGLCLGCTTFGLLMRPGVIPEAVCEDCNDFWARRAAAA